MLKLANKKCIFYLENLVMDNYKVVILDVLVPMLTT